MIYPKFIKEKGVIGVTAPSDGLSKDSDFDRLDNAKKKLLDIGIDIKETLNVRKSFLGRSSSAYDRARQLESLFLDDEVDVIVSAGGGEFMIEILSLLDYDLIKNNPKWFQGYSDPTCLIHVLTTKYDIATIYSNNIKVFGMEEWHKSLDDNISILRGNLIEQCSFDKFEKDKVKEITGFEMYNLSSGVYWKNLYDEDKINFRGRVIGGCIDVLSDLYGTEYDNTINFLEKYKSDGIVWYFENCYLSCEALTRTLWKFKESGYFEYTKGIIFGRSLSDMSFCGLNYEDTLKSFFEDMNIPVVIDADFGHVPPRVTIINGAIGEFSSCDGKGSIKFYLE